VITDSNLPRADVRSQESSTAVLARALLALERGTAYVESVSFDRDVATVQLLYPMGRRSQIALPVVPRREEYKRPTNVDRLIAVDVRREVAGVQCSAIATSRRGPARVPISLAQALAYAHVGVHTVFRTK
jgi:hypothetical protein